VNVYIAGIEIERTTAHRHWSCAEHIPVASGLERSIKDRCASGIGILPCETGRIYCRGADRQSTGAVLHDGSARALNQTSEVVIKIR
jgi:hypothetical protein